MRSRCKQQVILTNDRSQCPPLQSACFAHDSWQAREAERPRQGKEGVWEACESALSERAFWAGRHGFLPPKDLNPLELWEAAVCVGYGAGQASVTGSERCGLSVVPRLVTGHLLIPKFSRCLGRRPDTEAGEMWVKGRQHPRSGPERKKATDSDREQAELRHRGWQHRYKLDVGHLGSVSQILHFLR